MFHFREITWTERSMKFELTINLDWTSDGLEGGA